jgi:diguanylate cyclase (GGDEF)-like protein/PAS domain S-box-containing protein
MTKALRHRIRARLPVPADPLLKIRGVFTLLGAAAIVSLIPVVVFHGTGTPATRAAVVATLVVLTARRIAGFRRATLSLRGEPLEALAIFGVCVTAGAPESLGLVYSALYLRPLLGSLRQATAAALAYVAAHIAGVLAGPADPGYTLVDVAQQLPGFALSVVALGMLARALDEQTRNERRFEALVRNSTDVITVSDAAGRITYQSEAVTDLLGWSAAEQVGTPLMQQVHADDLPVVKAHFGQTLTGGDQGPLTARLRHRDGGWRWVENLTVNCLDDPAVRGVIIHSRDVGERHRLEERLRGMAFHDELTGLANRTLLNDRIDHALAARRRDGDAIAMLAIDLDDFKAINDSLGHAAGDRVLEQVAARLADNARDGDTVARLGGDEFAVFIEHDAEPSRLIVLAERLLAALAEPMALAETSVSLRASIGAAVAEAPITREVLLRHADAAMYIAKQSGGGFELYTDDRDPRIGEHVRLVSELRETLAADALDVHFQPVLELDTNRVVALEALVRWHHPTRGLIAPDAFVPAAERSGLIGQLTDQVLRRSLDAVRTLEDCGHMLDVAVNIAPGSLDDSDLVRRVHDALAASGLDGDRLTFEVTERTLLMESDRARRTVRELGALGVALSIDDFGTGHSSLTRLRRLAVAELKIDRSFVADMLVDEGDATIVQSTINLAHGLGIRVVAEGVEDRATAQALHARGCDRVQGYGILPPRPLDELRTWLETATVRART